MTRHRRWALIRDYKVSLGMNKARLAKEKPRPGEEETGALRDGRIGAYLPPKIHSMLFERRGL